MEWSNLPTHINQYCDSEAEHFDFIVEKRKQMFVKFGAVPITQSRCWVHIKAYHLHYFIESFKIYF
jgi:hypothetical protein